MLQPVLIGGEWRQSRSPQGEFQAVSPLDQEASGDRFPISGTEDLDQALAEAQAAISSLDKSSPDRIASFLEIYAQNIERNAEPLVRMAAEETALPIEPRLLTIELPRTVDQLRQAAAAAQDRSWCQAVIDTRLNIRSKFSRLGGPIVVFGPNNFPLAFNSIAGGDFAAAMAAGNSVIAKAHPGHPGTTRLLAEYARQALQDSHLPSSMCQMIYHLSDAAGLDLVSQHAVGATAFTGSRKSGLALKRAADCAGKPIYLELSGVNPVLVLPGALEERAEEIASELSGSCTLGAGQFCTNPGLVILIGGEYSQRFLQHLGHNLETTPTAPLLSRGVRENLSEAIAHFKTYGAQVLCGGYSSEEQGFHYANTLLSVPGRIFLKNSEPLRQEAFGPVTVAVLAHDEAELLMILENLEGNLTGSVYSQSQGKDDALYARVEPILRPRVGRLINDKMPTGVAVNPAMVHGGPFPATGHPGFTSVGIPRSLLRFAALQCYDNVRLRRLPVELQNKNPTGNMWRYIDGAWTQKDIL
ncbi:MAG: aldehyde dehydrogenase family protein [Candidatus Aminicenantes bacterium]|nr:aldehyde dehydrogenase family protein [Candidatus Aminicenantes bacterium]